MGWFFTTTAWTPGYWGGARWSASTPSAALAPLRIQAKTEDPTYDTVTEEDKTMLVNRRHEDAMWLSLSDRQCGNCYCRVCVSWNIVISCCCNSEMAMWGESKEHLERTWRTQGLVKYVERLFVSLLLYLFLTVSYCYITMNIHKVSNWSSSCTTYTGSLQFRGPLHRHNLDSSIN
jgi:hypothetical protein